MDSCAARAMCSRRRHFCTFWRALVLGDRTGNEKRRQRCCSGSDPEPDKKYADKAASKAATRQPHHILEMPASRQHPLRNARQERRSSLAEPTRRRVAVSCVRARTACGRMTMERHRPRQCQSMASARLQLVRDHKLSSRPDQIWSSVPLIADSGGDC